MGVVLDFADMVERVATAVFPSVEVIGGLKARGFAKGVLIAHHPMDCNLRTREVWSFPDAEAIRFLCEAGIGLYALHTPLDRDGPCGTGRTFARALGLEVAGTFFCYEGHNAGVYGSTAVQDLGDLVESAVGHAVAAHRYGGGGFVTDRGSGRRDQYFCDRACGSSGNRCDCHRNFRDQ